MAFDTEKTREGAETDTSLESVRGTWDASAPPSTAIVEAVALANGRDPQKMPPLYDCFDVEALDGLLTADRSERAGNIAVSFTYDGTYVWVSSDGTIEIDPEAASLR